MVITCAISNGIKYPHIEMVVVICCNFRFLWATLSHRLTVLSYDILPRFKSRTVFSLFVLFSQSLLVSLLLYFFIILLFLCCFVELALGIAIIPWIKTETVTARDTCVFVSRFRRFAMWLDCIALHCIRKCSIEFTFYSIRRVTHEIFVFVKRVVDFLFSVVFPI